MSIARWLEHVTLTTGHSRRSRAGRFLQKEEKNMTTTTDPGILAEAQELLANRLREESKREQMNCGSCPLDARNPDYDCAAPDCLDDQDVPAFLRPQAG